MKPIVFLDVDGVMNNPDCYDIWHLAMEKLTLEEAKAGYEKDIHIELLFSPTCVAHLNTVTDTVDADIVLSSSWRMLYWDKREKFKTLMDRVGVKAKVIDFTPHRGCGGKQRGDEITHWLRTHRNDGANIVVLDDDDDMLAIAPWFVQTDGAVGLTTEDVDRALAILRGEMWPRRAP